MSAARMPIRHALASLYWRCSRWRLVREEPKVDSARVIIGAPHTSNWDFVLMLAIAWDARMRIHWLGKRELFAGPFGPVMRALGGIEVDRANPAGIVEAVIQRARTEEGFALVVTPEGTRAGSGWRSGFWRIARGADLPLTLGYVDRTTMTTGLGPTLTLSDDVGAEMDRIRAFYADKSGMIPAKRTEPRLASEQGEAGAADAAGGEATDGAPHS